MNVWQTCTCRLLFVFLHIYRRRNFISHFPLRGILAVAALKPNGYRFLCLTNYPPSCRFRLQNLQRSSISIWILLFFFFAGRKTQKKKNANVLGGKRHNEIGKYLPVPWTDQVNAFFLSYGIVFFSLVINPTTKRGCKTNKWVATHLV